MRQTLRVLPLEVRYEARRQTSGLAFVPVVERGDRGTEGGATCDFSSFVGSTSTHDAWPLSRLLNSRKKDKALQ